MEVADGKNASELRAGDTVLLHNALGPLIAVTQLKVSSALNYQISGARDWQELIKIIVEFPRNIMPLSSCTLILYDPAPGPLDPERMAGWYSLEAPTYQPSGPGRIELACSALRESRKFQACECPLTRSSVPGAQRYCAPLTSAHQPVGLLHLYAAPDVFMTDDQEDLLESVLPAVALAIENARGKQLVQLIQEKSDAELKRIARDLHDNLAQDLLYVGMKLEQLIGSDSLENVAAAWGDLRRMHTVVNAAYLELRGTLTGILDSGLSDLTPMLQRYVESVRDRLGYSLMLTVTGQPERIPNRVARQVLLIFRELLTNADKHADAANVDVKLDWEQDAVTLSVVDNGRGFEPDQQRPDGHLGMVILRERAEAIKGKLTIESSLGRGTSVTLRLPKPLQGQLAR